MSRDISATNLAEINAAHLQPVTLVKLEFGTPVYAHSGYGTITYDGDDYLGVGQLGAITGEAESENLTPSPVTISLSGVDSALITEALDSGSYGDTVTIFEGYRQDDGTLVDDPWVLWKGSFEYAAIRQDADSQVSITVKHDLAVLSEKDGGRYTDEDQQSRFTGDVGFEYITDMSGVDLRWGGSKVIDPAGRGDVRPPRTDDRL